MKNINEIKKQSTQMHFVKDSDLFGEPNSALYGSEEEVVPG
jgi:hypothetical protein